jgi:hypothetical protein
MQKFVSETEGQSEIFLLAETCKPGQYLTCCINEKIEQLAGGRLINLRCPLLRTNHNALSPVVAGRCALQENSRFIW